MKQLTCEMCGSTELVKQDGFFVCQTCGTKYSVEEAKKMMIEGTVEVKGTVKIDHSEQIESYYALAETACNSNNFEQTEEYCNKLIEIDPNNYKAWFLKGKAVGWQSSVKTPRIEESIQCFTKSLQLIPEDIEDRDDIVDSLKEEAVEEFEEMAEGLVNICFTHFSENPTENNKDRLMLNLNRTSRYINLIKEGLSVDNSFSSFDQNLAHKLYGSGIKGTTSTLKQYATPYDFDDFKNIKKQFDMCLELMQIGILMYKKKMDAIKQEHIESLKEMSNVFEEDIVEEFKEEYARGEELSESIYISMCKNIIGTYELYNEIKYVDRAAGVVGSLTNNEKSVNLAKIEDYYRLIKEVDPDYGIPSEDESQETKNTSNTKSGGCYVATCVYGSYDCPQVWTLRRYRDNTLGATWYGRAFIRTYYAISPTLVKWFGSTNWFKKMWKGKLDRMVEKLRSNGVEDTPYEDKNW